MDKIPIGLTTIRLDKQESEQVGRFLDILEIIAYEMKRKNDLKEKIFNDGKYDEPPFGGV